MKTSRIVLALIIMLGALVLQGPAAAQQPQPEWNFVSLNDTSYCGTNGAGGDVILERVNIEGMGIFYWDTVAKWGDETLMDEYFPLSFGDGTHGWGIYDQDDRGRQTMSFDDLPPGAFVDVTITLWSGDSEPVVLDQDYFSFQCGQAVPVPSLGNPGLAVLLLIISAMGIMTLGRRHGAGA